MNLLFSGSNATRSYFYNKQYAEGFGRQTYKEKVQFFYMAQGSITELKNQVFICRDLGYLSDNQVGILMSQIQLTHQLLQGLITKSKSFMKS